MKFFRTTFAGGILFLAPLVIVVIIIGKALGFVHKLVEPLAVHLPFESVVGLRTSMLLAIIVLILMCFGAGVFARTKLARRIVGWLETNLLSNLPGYDFFKSMGEGILGVENAETQQVVLAHLDDAWQIGFLTERLDNGLLAVFVPDAPNPRAGSVCFMKPENVKFMDNLAPAAAQKMLRRLGNGTNELLGHIKTDSVG